MHEDPWNIRGNAVVIMPYDGITQPSKVKLDTLDIWIQIHDVPSLFAHLVPTLASKVGEVLFAECHMISQEISSVSELRLMLTNH